MIPRALLVALVWSLLASPASADPISLSAYEGALSEARAQVDAARRVQGNARELAVRNAILALENATQVRVGSAVYTAAPHGAIVALLRAGDDASLARAGAMLDETLEAVRRAEAIRPPDPARARSSLDTILAGPDFRRAPNWGDIVIGWLRDLLAGLFPDIRVPRVNLSFVTALLGATAILLLGLIAWLTLRGFRGKVTRELVLARTQLPRGPGAQDRLRAAEEATRAGRLREALRELFLAAILALDERGALRADPALTDRELIARAAGSPRASDLERLVALYERAWYGLREPSRDDVDRASQLARRIAA